MASSGGSLEKAFFAKLENVDSGKGSVFHFQFNPKDFKVNMAADWKEDESHGTKDKPKPFVNYNRGKAGTMTMVLFFDTTDTPSENVHTKYILPLTDLLRPQFKDPPAKKDAVPRSRPPYCMFGWGTLEFRGVVTKVDVVYLLFKSDGSPLRAQVTIAMLEQPVYGGDMTVAKGENDPLKALVSAKTAAVKRTDPSKIEGHSKVISYTAKPGDTVTSIAEETGAAPADIAEANNLDDLTHIDPGTVLAIPFGPAAAAAMSVIADMEKTAGKWAEAAAGAAAELAEEALEAVASLFEDEAAALAVVGVVFTSAAAATVMAGAGKSGKSKAGGGGKAGKGKGKSKAKKAEYTRSDKAAEEADEGAAGADFKAKEFDKHEAGAAADFEAKEFEAAELSETEAAEEKKAEYTRKDKAAKAGAEGAKGADFKAKEFDAPEAEGAGEKGEAKKAEYTRNDKESKAAAEGAKGAEYTAKTSDAPKAGEGADFKAKTSDAPKAGEGAAGEKAEPKAIERNDKAPAAAAEGAKGAPKAEPKPTSDAKAGAGQSGESKSSSDNSAGKGAGGGGAAKAAPPSAAADARSQAEKDVTARAESVVKGEANAAKTAAVTEAKGAVREAAGVDENGQKTGGDKSGGGNSQGSAGGGKSAGSASSSGSDGGKSAASAPAGKSAASAPAGKSAAGGGPTSGSAPSAAPTAAGAPASAAGGGGKANPAAADSVAKAVEAVKDTIEDA